MPRRSCLLVLSTVLAACSFHPSPPAPRRPQSASPPAPTAAPPAPTPPPTATPRLSLAPPSPRSLLGGDLPPLTDAALRLVERAQAQRAAGDAAAARETLERAVEIDPTCAFAYYDLAALHLDDGHAEQAAAFADKALVVGGSYGNEWLSHAQVLLGRALQEQGDTQAAADAYRRALALDAGNLPAKVALQALQ